MILSVNISIQCDIPLISSETWAHTQEPFFSRSSTESTNRYTATIGFLSSSFQRKKNKIKRVGFLLLFVYNPLPDVTFIRRKRGGENSLKSTQTGLLFLHLPPHFQGVSKALGDSVIITVRCKYTWCIQVLFGFQHPPSFFVRQKQGSFFPFGKWLADEDSRRVYPLKGFLKW